MRRSHLGGLLAVLCAIAPTLGAQTLASWQDGDSKRAIVTFAATKYGIPPEQVIGSSGVTRFEIDATGKPVLRKEAKVEIVDDGAGKPESINRVIGRRPIFAFGNSDGDLQMLQWTAGAPSASFVGIVHHTDANREFAYDRASRIGRLDRALDEARTRGWTIVDMKNDWREVFPRVP